MKHGRQPKYANEWSKDAQSGVSPRPPAPPPCHTRISETNLSVFNGFLSFDTCIAEIYTYVSRL